MAARIQKEAELIWDRDPSWNQIGSVQLRDPMTRNGACILGRRRRWGLVKRLVTLKRREGHWINIGP